jgi:hypothetical protein
MEKESFHIFPFKNLSVEEIFRTGREWWKKIDTCYAVLVYQCGRKWIVARATYTDFDLETLIAVPAKI